MPKVEKVKVNVNVKDKVDDNSCDLSLCGLSEVPVKEIASIKRITILDLSSNNLTSLGKNFANLTRLVKVDLSKNQIKYLPDNFGHLNSLRHLVLYDNALEHLPMSFGNLTNLRYLDLKGNPLSPSLAEVVGYCLTKKDCQEAAKKTVKFLAQMKSKAEKATENVEVKVVLPEVEISEEPKVDEKEIDLRKSKKAIKKAKKLNKKNQKSNSQANNNNTAIKKVNIEPPKPRNKSPKAAKTKKIKSHAKKSAKKNSTALSSIFAFFLLLIINVGVIYVLMFRRPEIADAIVSYIPPEYSDWIVTNTEIFRLHVSDWISQFRTPPEEH